MTTEEKHTPTPWKQGPQSSNGWRDILGGDVVQVATVWVSPDLSQITDEQCEANARRIVASVNLLAALTVETIEALTPADVKAMVERRAVEGTRVGEAVAAERERCLALVDERTWKHDTLDRQLLSRNEMLVRLMDDIRGGISALAPTNAKIQ